MRTARILLLTACSFIFTGFAYADQDNATYCYVEAGEYYNISPLLLKGLSKTESNHNPTAINYNKNGTIDYGHMQINSSWKDALGKRWDYLGNPCYSTFIGAWILKQCQIKHGNTWNSVACYNSGRPLYALTGDTRKRVEGYVSRVQKAIYGEDQK